jgi:hypothetical protein
MVVLPRPLSPGSIGDDVAVLSEQGFDDLEDPRVPDGALHDAAAIEHLVPEGCRLVWGVSTIIGRVLLEDPFDIRTEGCELLPGDHTLEYDVPVRLESLHRSGGRVRTDGQISGRPS